MLTRNTQSKKHLPAWLKRRLPARGAAASVRALLADLHLATVCDGAHCPNISECYSRGTAAFLILGRKCTRRCRFCAIPTDESPAPPRQDEPQAVAQAARRMGLRHVVITSVTRDDLPDGGAGHFARTIRAVKADVPDAIVEVLTPDFKGSTDAIDTVLAAGCHIFNHNVETVPRL
ncbi:MAG: lipoyl synthase, partial [Planctomycetota bacterium]